MHALPGESSPLIACFVVWSGLAIFLLRKRNWKITLRTSFMLMTGFAVLAALSMPAGQSWLHHNINDHQWFGWALIVGATVAAVGILWISES
jgi:hypothetical protein